MKRKIYYSAFISAFLFALTTSPVLAISTTGSTAASLAQQKQQLIAEKKQNMASTKCAKIESNIQTRISRYNDGKVRRLNAYNSLKTRLMALESKLSTRGYDTSALKADLPKLQTKIDKFSSDYAVYIAALSDTQTYACGKSEGEFRAQLLDSKDLLETVHADSKDIKSFYDSTIKPDLIVIKKQTPTIKQSNGNANLNTNNSNTNQ